MSLSQPLPVEPVAIEKVDVAWSSLLPFLILVGAGLVLMLASSLGRSRPTPRPFGWIVAAAAAVTTPCAVWFFRDFNTVELVTPPVDPEIGVAVPVPVGHAIAPAATAFGISGTILFLLLVAGVARKVPGMLAAFTAVGAILAGTSVVGLWERVQDVDRGPFTSVAGAFGVDGFSLFLTVVLCASVALCALLADGFLRREGLEGPELYVLLLLSASGGVLMAGANDLILLFLGLEILSIAVYVLAAMNARRHTSQEAGVKYFVLGAFASAFLLYGIALVYGATGTTNLVEILEFLSANTLFDDSLLVAGMAMLLVGFGFKIAAAPFHSWTPDVYQGSPSPVVAYMASGVKTAAFAGLLRVFFLALFPLRDDWKPVVYAIAVVTLAVGSILAVVQTDVKRMLAYSSISHAGFILIGVQAATERGVQASLFYLAAYTFQVAGSFGIVTLVGRAGDDKHSLDDYRGLARSRPALALTFSVLLFSQAGVPFTSGFFAKFYALSAAVDSGSEPLAVVAMFSAVIAAFLYLRITVSMWMADDDVEAPTGIAIPGSAAAVLVICLAVTIGLGLWPAALTEPAADAVAALVSF